MDLKSTQYIEKTGSVAKAFLFLFLLFFCFFFGGKLSLYTQLFFLRKKGKGKEQNLQFHGKATVVAQLYTHAQKKQKAEKQKKSAEYCKDHKKYRQAHSSF